MSDIKKDQGLISSIRDKLGNEISFKSGSNPDEELYLRKFNAEGTVIYKGAFKHNKREGLHYEFDDTGAIKSLQYFKDDNPVDMPLEIKLYSAVEKGDLHKVKEVLTDSPRLVNLTTPEELQTFPATSEKEPFSILELSIKNNYSLLSSYLLDSGARTDDYSIHSIHDTRDKKHDPLQQAIKTLNNSLIQKMLTKNPEILQMHHKELLKSIKDKISQSTIDLTDSINFVNTNIDQNKKLKM
jgi:hypothetical protein